LRALRMCDSVKSKWKLITVLCLVVALVVTLVALVIPTVNSCFMIAASDASTQVKAQADYICDGTADDVEINAAITAAATSFTTRSVVLLPGNYCPSASIDMADDITVEGRGDSVVMALTSNMIVFDFGTTDCATLRNITIDGDGRTYGGAGFGMVVGSADVYGGLIGGADNKGVNATNAIVEDMTFFELGDGVGSFNTAITFQHGSKISVQNNRVIGCVAGYIRICQSDDSTVTGNIVIVPKITTETTGGIAICCPRNVICSQNIIIGGGKSEGRGAIWVGAFYRDSYNCKITDNIISNEFIAGRSGITMIGGGVYQWNVDNIEISRNIVYGILDAPCIGNAEMADATGNWSWANVRISGNTLSDGSYGIRMGDIGNCSLEVYVGDNDISDTSVAPMLFDSSVSSIVSLPVVGFTATRSPDVFPTQREGNTVVWVDSEGAFFIHGGNRSRIAPIVGQDSEIYKYVPGSNPVKVLDILSPVHHTTMTYDIETGLVYLYGGGYDPNEGGNAIQWFDPATYETGLVDLVMPYNLVGCNAEYSTVQDKIYVFIGFGVGVYVNEVWKHDPIAGTFTQISIEPFVGGDFLVFPTMVYVEPEDAIYIFGGIDTNSQTTTNIWRFDCATETSELLDAACPDEMTKFRGSYYDPALNVVVLAGGRHNPWTTEDGEGYTTRI